MPAMSLGQELTRWSIRVALAAYVVALAAGLLARRRSGFWPVLRLTWTAGCVAYLVHVACAFQFAHGWSHTAAYEETARRTAALTHRRTDAPSHRPTVPPFP